MALKKTIAAVLSRPAGPGGCGRQPSTTKRLAFITNNAADFWTIARKGTEKADAELADVEVEFRLGDGTAAEQKRIVDDLLAKGVDGIAISPVDPANQTAMLNDAAKQALVFTHDSDAPDSKRECYVGTDNVAAGPAGGRADQGGAAAGRQDRHLRRQARRAQRPGAAAGHQGSDCRVRHRDHRRAHRRHRSGARQGQRVRRCS